MKSFLARLFGKTEKRKIRNILSEDDKRNIVTMHGQGYKIKDIANEYNVSYSHTARIIRRSK